MLTLTIFIGGLLISPAYASVRGLEGIDIISREEWGADESLTRGSNASYDRAENEYEAYQAWLDGVGVDRGGKFAARKKNDEIKDARKEYFESNYPEEIVVEEDITHVDGHELWRSQSINTQKTKIVVHHTAGTRTYPTEEDAMSGVYDIFKFHTVQRGWGDVGYNFLIDPYGNIYEGRAGGRGAIGAHAESNNVKSIGIALMGNYDEREPSEEMINSLIRLITVLSIEFDITPTDKKTYFTPINYEPYIEAHEHSSIVGHQDTKLTACPGHYVYDMLPEIKAKVAVGVAFYKDLGDEGFLDVSVRSITKPYYIEGSEGFIEIPFDQGGKLECISANANVGVRSCDRGSNSIRLKLKRTGYPASGRDFFIVRVGNQFYLLDTMIVWQWDLDRLLSTKRKAFRDRQGDPSPEKKINKIIDKVELSEVRELMETDVRVLLYELTAEYDAWDMQCLGRCHVRIDEQKFENVTEFWIDEDKKLEHITVRIGDDVYTGDAVHVENHGMVQITNYPRAGSAGPWNLFRGDLYFHKEEYYHLTLGFIERYVVINELPLDEYMKGVGEASEYQHEEKLKTMTLLAKGYMLYYLNGKNKHPNIPEDASYNGVDDPRIFQKYVGAGWESYGKKWLAALEETKDEVILYKGYLPILPYFHCSAGFTWSALEKFGWKDTPYLKGVIDFATCESGLFEGHGVGLSGDGAEALAQKGIDYKSIIRYFYDGVRIAKFD